MCQRSSKTSRPLNWRKQKKFTGFVDWTGCKYWDSFHIRKWMHLSVCPPRQKSKNFDDACRLLFFCLGEIQSKKNALDSWRNVYGTGILLFLEWFLPKSLVLNLFSQNSIAQVQDLEFKLPQLFSVNNYRHRDSTPTIEIHKTQGWSMDPWFDPCESFKVAPITCAYVYASVRFHAACAPKLWVFERARAGANRPNTHLRILGTACTWQSPSDLCLRVLSGV